MKFEDYDPAQILSANDITLFSTTQGTRKVSLADLANNITEHITSEKYYDFLDKIISPEQRNLVFRGKSLGTSFTNDQKAVIKNGTFKGLFIGDYWEYNGNKWRIADFNYWLNTGDTSLTTNHIVIFPDKKCSTSYMNPSPGTTEGGYVNSNMRTNMLAKNTMGSPRYQVNHLFGESNILIYRESLVNAVTNGYSTGCAWYDCDLEIPTECMMYGSYVYTPVVSQSIIPMLTTVSTKILSLFQINKKYTNYSREHCWLRDVVSSTEFALCHGYGTPAYAISTASMGVKPVFGIIG